MLSRILRTIEERRLLAPGDRVLVAVSGGPDSVALLLALDRLRERLGIHLRAATVDHGLRPEAAAEGDQVGALCANHGIACERLRVDVRAERASAPHLSWQDAARRVRLAALAAAAERGGERAVALGHTADDQAETVLFRIVRGTGVRGLAGIPYARPPFVRPLLDVRRREVLSFLGKASVAFVEDPSNLDRRFARARVRHDWLPFLERENPRLVEGLLALADDARRNGAPRPLPGPGTRRARATVDRLARLGQGTHRVATRGGQYEISYGRVLWQAAGDPPAVEPSPVTIPGPGRFTLVQGGPALELTDGGGPETSPLASNGPAGAAPFDADALAWPLELRSWKPGDRMRPRGGRGSRKLQDLLVDAKIPRFERGRLPVLVAADGEVLFVPGLRPAERGRPSQATRRLVQVRVLDRR